MWHSSSPRRGKHLPPFIGARVWRHFPYSSEAALIWDPSYWGSLREDPLCKRHWWFWNYSGLIPSINLNTDHLCPVHRTQKYMSYLERCGLVTKWFWWGHDTVSLPSKMKSEWSAKKRVLCATELSYSQPSVRDWARAFGTGSKPAIKLPQQWLNWLLGVLWATILSVSPPKG